MTKKIIAAALFLLFLSTGNYLAQRKPLWNDEIYTQVRTLDRLSYQDILLNRMTEGNNCPLFYLIQKGICDAFHYKFPFVWDGEWYVGDLPSQTILRIGSNVFMALSLTAIFYFFARYYSGLAGFYSLLISMSSFMVWAYCAEARPYALWFFLTTLQALLFLRATVPSRIWRWLAAVHFLLALTITFSVVQILIVSGLLWFLREKDWKKYIFMTGIPVAICFFYYWYSPHFKFFFLETPWQLVSTNIPADRLSIAAGFGLLWLLSELRRNRNFVSESNAVEYLMLMISILAASFFALLVFKMRQPRIIVDGFSLSSRYFIYLTPIGIIGTVLFSVHLLRAFRSQRWMFVNIALGLAGLLMIRFLRTFIDVYNSGLY